MKKTVILGLLGTVLDAGPVSTKRWSKWRPSVSLCQHEDFLVNRLEIIFPAKFKTLAGQIEEDITSVSPETEFRGHQVEMKNPWDFEEVYAQLHDFFKAYPFDTEKEDYLLHITTGTHVAQICLYLLTESHFFPGKLIQTSPPSGRMRGSGAGAFTVIDLDLSRYDKIATRFLKERIEGVSYLKSGIETKNQYFNRLIETIEKVSINSKSPILLMGPVGAGKSKLAKKIFELKKNRRQVEGQLVEVNCATLQGEGAMSALFGHVKGAFTGAANDRPGLLRKANNGILFLDEIGELKLDEQAMLLRALEEKTFLPMGSDSEVTSDFQLIAGTNRNLSKRVKEGHFREDLLARINLWTFNLPALKDRREDIEPNINYELEEFSRVHNSRLTFNKESIEKYLRFAKSPEAEWSGNFRDLNASITRMGTMAPGGRINLETLNEEIERLRDLWKDEKISQADSMLKEILGEEKAFELDLFDQMQIERVIEVCRKSKNLANAGKVLYAQSRKKMASPNDSDRLRKYLAKFGITWGDLKGIERTKSI
ncbi:MAG: RNA repair transcriptional activator RtcR [Nitrospinales bacterium]